MELPEVEVMRRDLDRDVVGKKIKSVEVKGTKNAMRAIRRHKTRKEFTSRVAGHKITKVERRGKYILMHLDAGDVLVVHFGMSGQFQRGTGRLAVPPHTHVVADVPAGRRPPLHRPADVRRDVRRLARRDRQDQGAAAHRDRSARPGVHVADVPVPARREGREDEAAADGPEVHQRDSATSTPTRCCSARASDSTGCRNTLSSQEVRRLYRAIQEVLQDAIKAPRDDPGRRGVRRPVRQAGRVPERAEGLRPDGVCRAGDAARRSRA